MWYKTLVLLLLLSSCVETDDQSKKNAKKLVVAKQLSLLFTGNFEGVNAGKSISISLNADKSNVSGLLMMNGESAKITGISKNNKASGQIKELASGKIYSFTAEQKLNDLSFSITFPEYNNQVVKMDLKKITTANAAIGKKQRDQNLIGTWRNTEVISSGSGEFYSSFSTDYFARFNADGTALVWKGKSAGGSKNATIDASSNGNAQKMKWYTSGKTLYLVDPGSKQESAVIFYAEPNRMMLTSNKSKKVYQRIN